MMIGRGCIINTLQQKEDDSGYVTGGCKSEDGKLSCGYSSFRGKRASMEDFYDVKMSNINGNTVCLFGIFDGHGGSRAAEYLKQHLFENLTNHPQFMTDTKLAISETYKKTDTQFLDAEKDNCRDDGSTASTAILVQNHLYVANVGDSRAVVSKAGKAIPLSEDQKPNRSDERKRIESAGGVVMWAGTWRVGGVLAMSRAFGNRMLKQYVVAEPEIQELEVNTELELIVLASDGLWDVVPNEDAVSIARAEEEPETAARKLTETAFSRGSADNITCIVVKFNHGTGEVLAPHSEHNEETERHENENEKAEDTRPEVKKEQPKSHAVHDQKTENKLPSETGDSAAHLAGTFGEKSSVFEFVETGIGSDGLHSTNTIDRRFCRPVKRKKAVPSESASFPHPSLLEDARGPLPEEVHAINSNSSREIASLKRQKRGSYSHTDSHAMESSSHEAPVEGVTVTELRRLVVEAEEVVEGLETLIRKDEEKDREIEQLKKTIATLRAEKDEADVRCAEQYIRNATLNNSLSSVERKVVELEDGQQTMRDRARELSERLEEMERRAKAVKEDLLVAMENKLLNVNAIQAKGYEDGYRAAFRDTKARMKKVNPNFDFVKYERLEKEHFEARAAKLRAAKARLEEFGLSFCEG